MTSLAIHSLVSSSIFALLHIAQRCPSMVAIVTSTIPFCCGVSHTVNSSLKFKWYYPVAICTNIKHFILTINIHTNNVFLFIVTSQMLDVLTQRINELILMFKLGRFGKSRVCICHTVPLGVIVEMLARCIHNSREVMMQPLTRLSCMMVLCICFGHIFLLCISSSNDVQGSIIPLGSLHFSQWQYIVPFQYPNAPILSELCS